MINAKFFKSGDLYTGFCVEGHSGSAESGQDIICAFVSSACYMAANTITEVIKLSATAEQSDGYLSLSIKEATDMMAKEIEEEVFELPDSKEEASTSLGSLFANIKLD